MTQITAATLIAAGFSESMAYHAIAGTRQIGIPLALWLYENDGLKVGPLVNRSVREITILRQVHEPKAPQSILDRRQQQSKAAA